MQNKIIKLRAIEPSDAELLFIWENEETLWQFSDTIAPFSKYTIEQFILNDNQDIYTTKQIRLMIDDITGQTPLTVGCIDLFDFDPYNMRAGIGILIWNDYASKGYATEALKLIINFAFETLHLKQIYCNIGTDNIKSIKLFTKAGFKITGTKKSWKRNGNKWLDIHFLQLINNII